MAPSTPALSSAAKQTSLEPHRLEASATHAQHSGFAMLEALRRELSSSSLSSADSVAGLEQTESSSTPEESDTDREERLDKEDEKAAEQEVERYLSEERANATTNILEYWEVRQTFPSMHTDLAPDILPYSAGSIPSRSCTV